MPKTPVIFFQDTDGTVPFKAWLDTQVSKRDQRAAAKCHYVLSLLESNGSQLRRPHADYLRDGIYELRSQFGGVNYRILYFFSSKGLVVVSHGITKLMKVPDKEIDLALERRAKWESDPERYSYGN